MRRPNSGSKGGWHFSKRGGGWVRRKGAGCSIHRTEVGTPTYKDMLLFTDP
jgi:hypothetical protein